MPVSQWRCCAFVLLVFPLTLAGVPTLAHAQSPPAGAVHVDGKDIVHLKNGGMISGQILEVLPGDSLTVVSAATKESKRFAWTEIASFDRGGAKTTVTTDPPIREHEALHAGPGAPRLHIELTRPADLKLFEITADVVVSNFRTGFSSATAFRPVCVAPCDLVIDGRRGQSFFFNGDRVLKSREFSLLGRSGDLVARVKPGRPGLRVGGIAVLSLGAAGLGISAYLFQDAYSSSKDQRYDDMNHKLPLADPNYSPAIALLISGALVAAGGLAMILLSRTRITWKQRTAAARRRLGLG